MLLLYLLVISLFITAAIVASEDKKIPPSPNQITLPRDYKDWRVLSTTHRTDNQTLRIISGNDIALDAVREGSTNPWPEGTILAKMVWQERSLDAWKEAIVPGQFIHVEFMVKDPKRFPSTGGWGFARWTGKDYRPFGKDPHFEKECFKCHEAVRSKDHVFTIPALIP